MYRTIEEEREDQMDSSYTIVTYFAVINMKKSQHHFEEMAVKKSMFETSPI